MPSGWRNRPDERRLPKVPGDGEDAGAPGLERPRHLGEPSRGVQNMLKHILGDHHIEGGVREGLLFQVLTSVSVLDASREDIRIPMGSGRTPCIPSPTLQMKSLPEKTRELPIRRQPGKYVLTTLRMVCYCEHCGSGHILSDRGAIHLLCRRPNDAHRSGRNRRQLGDGLHEAGRSVTIAKRI